MNSSYSPQINRIALLRRASLAGAALLLTFCMSVYVPTPWPKVTMVLAVLCLLAVGRRIFDRAYAPLFAIIAYDLAVTMLFPGAKPDLLTVLQRPLFYSLCLLLGILCLHGKAVRASYLVMFGILSISIAGAVGDLMGHDMTAMLPFQMPNEAFFDQVTMDASGASRIRGFFPESGVLGAVSMSVATCLGLGAIALLAARVKTGRAWAALGGAGLAGLAILALTITKSGAFLALSGIAGFILVMAVSRRRAYRGAAVAGMAAVIGGTALFGALAPSNVTSYFKGEIGAAVFMRDTPTAMMGDHSGMITRVECWKLAIYCVRYYPLGVGVWGHGAVLGKDTPVRPSPEMEYFFNQDVYGLKNAFANLLAETGVVGMGLLLYWMWSNFIAPARRLGRERDGGSVMAAGLYVASAFCSLAFLFSCELYPYFSLLLLLKLHADAVAAEVEKAAPEAEEELDEAEAVGPAPAGAAAT